MNEVATPNKLLERPLNPDVVAALKENPDGILEQLAGRHGVSTFEVVRALPETHRRVLPGDKFQEVMADIAEWGKILFIVHTANIVLECKGNLPPGSFARGYYNIHGDSPIGGHIKADRCAAIVLVSRPFMGRASASVQFFDGEGEAMFKIFVARDADKALLPDQLDRFMQLRDRFQ